MDGPPSKSPPANARLKFSRWGCCWPTFRPSHPSCNATNVFTLGLLLAVFRPSNPQQEKISGSLMTGRNASRFAGPLNGAPFKWKIYPKFNRRKFSAGVVHGRRFDHVPPAVVRQIFSRWGRSWSTFRPCAPSCSATNIFTLGSPSLVGRKVAIPGAQPRSRIPKPSVCRDLLRVSVREFKSPP